MTISVTLGDCVEALSRRDGPLFDACVCDPPYHLTSIVRRFGGANAAPAKPGTDGAFVRASTGFMGQTWDGGDVALRPETWRAVYDQLKPGAHLAAFSHTRTYHRMACAIEDAGFEIRDQLAWTYGTGFPKSHDVGSGWGTALKPAWEPICLARKPVDQPTIASNVAVHGTGGLNISGCRVEGRIGRPGNLIDSPLADQTSISRLGKGCPASYAARLDAGEILGRFPANILHDGSAEVESLFPNVSSGERKATGDRPNKTDGWGVKATGSFDPSSGSAARFFYSAKAGPLDRLGSQHPTIKPVDLMRWLVRLVTPPKVLDFVCETCASTSDENTNLQALHCGLNQQTASDILLSAVPSGPVEDRPHPLCDLWDDDDASEAKVLLTRVPSDCAQGSHSDAASPSVQTVQSDVQASEGRREAVLFSGMCREEQRASEAQGEDQDHQWLLAGLSAGTRDGEQGGLYHGASLLDGGEDWTPLKDDGSGSSSERGQGRQSAGKSDANEQGGARSRAKNAKKSRPCVSSLPEGDQAKQLCSKCGSSLSRIDRPGLILDPFAGSGTTGIAAMAEGFSAELIDIEPTHVADIERKLAHLRGEGGRVMEAHLKRKATRANAPSPLFGDAA